MGILQAETGWCGFGLSAGLLPEIRAGWLRITIASLPLSHQLQGHNEALREMAAALKSAHFRIVRMCRFASDLEQAARRDAETIRQLELRLGESPAVRVPMAGKCT